MPLINVKLDEGVFTPDEKQQIIRRLTDTMVEIEGENSAPSPRASSKRLPLATGNHR
jgi:Tautomerase enzyme